ncbi:DUF6415 family natural product biosynthesis protein [Streptomyces syringium]|uniref:DUF6415 family natural product biosynthesis protein n=1 Tax=Streptomyces syringium TaxID=76729 RepID=UPI00343B1EE8
MSIANRPANLSSTPATEPIDFTQIESDVDRALSWRTVTPPFPGMTGLEPALLRHIGQLLRLVERRADELPRHSVGRALCDSAVNRTHEVLAAGPCGTTAQARADYVYDLGRMCSRLLAHIPGARP